MFLKVTTSLLFIIPAAVSWFEKIYFYSIIIFFSMISSIAYHLKNEKKYGYLDTITSVSLMTANLYFFYLSGFLFPYNCFIIVISIVSLYFWHTGHKKKYSLNHSLWHILSVIITLCCILSYLKIHK